MNAIQKIKGVADLFEPDSTAFTRLENVAREVFSRYGYAELRIPVLEKTELFARSIGEETDVVQKEMYTFPDRKGRMLTMRPEATAGIMRACIENKVFAERPVAKLFSFGPMFRYERPQKGRMRQFHQLDAELLGPKEPEADAEVLLMLWTYLRELGLKKLSFELNSLGCAQCRPGYRQALTDYYAGLDAAALCEDCQRRKDTNPLRVLDCKASACKEATAGAPLITDHLCAGCAGHFAALRAALDAQGVEYALNPRLVRGLDYYVGATFEITSTDIGSQTAVAGGGRYDGLIRDLGGPDVAGIGFAIGMERLAMLLPEAKPQAPDFFLALLDQAAAGAALALAQRLRGMGLRGDMDFAAGSPKSRLRAAGKSGARICLLLGADELNRGTVQAKDLAGGGQTEVPLADENALAALFANPGSHE
ncbi:MAG: histidine--tRNA ligase [Thermodesulfobacteriota bacterium]